MNCVICGAKTKGNSKICSPLCKEIRDTGKTRDEIIKAFSLNIITGYLERDEDGEWTEKIGSKPIIRAWWQ